jgi:hypothetical protein
MTVEKTPQAGKRTGVLLPILAIVAIGVVLRFTFVDALTKLTGTWMGGVESPRRAGSPAPDRAPGAGPSAA